ncbi:MAG: hypothetical protein ACON5B_08265 [Myxococcota bacterium]
MASWKKNAGIWTKIAVTTYLLAQILTGIEVGIVAACLVLLLDWSLMSALAVAVPAGFPLLLLQAGGIGWFFASLVPVDQPVEATVAST